MGRLKSVAMIIAVAGICLRGLSADAVLRTNAVDNAGTDIRMKMRARIKERMQKDRTLYGTDGLREIEMAYRAYAKSKDVDNENLQRLITKFSKANRTGCAVMYAGQRARGADDGKWFRLAIEKYGDCLYGNGVQVGAYARFYLARLLERKGDKDGAERLLAEIMKLYPDALTHRGKKMSDYLRQKAKDL